MKAAVTTACKGKNAKIAWIMPKRPNIAQIAGGKGNPTQKKDSF
jgi:hypothetical protein